jgi:hypothetical protein
MVCAGLTANHIPGAPFQKVLLGVSKKVPEATCNSRRITESTEYRGNTNSISAYKWRVTLFALAQASEFVSSRRSADADMVALLLALLPEKATKRTLSRAAKFFSFFFLSNPNHFTTHVSKRMNSFKMN